MLSNMLLDIEPMLGFNLQWNSGSETLFKKKIIYRFLHVSNLAHLQINYKGKPTSFYIFIFLVGGKRTSY